MKDEAIQIFNKCLSFKPTTGGVAWQSVHNYLFVCHTLKRDFNKCHNALGTVMNNPKFGTINRVFRQHWYIKEAFIYILNKNKKINHELAEVTPIRKFRINRFLNEIPLLSKDRKGFSTTIHIIHMIFLIIEKQYDSALNKILSLKQYSFRHLKTSEYDRVKTFIKMLVKVPENNYQLTTIKKKTKYLHQKLLSTPMDFSEQSMSIEIIPYEQLWEEILELLNNKD